MKSVMAMERLNIRGTHDFVVGCFVLPQQVCRSL